MPKGMQTTADVDNITAENIIQDVTDIARQEYTLREICDVINFNNELHGTIRYAKDSITGQEKVGELEEAEVDRIDFDSLDFNLWKNVVHVAVSRESELRADIETLAINIRDAGQDLARMENKQVAEELDAAVSEITGSDWGVDDNDPADDIMAAKSAIKDELYNPDTMVMSTDIYQDLVTNDNVRDQFRRGTAVRTDGELRAYAGLSIVLDDTNQLSDDHVYVLDTSAPVMVLADGPEWEAEYDMGTKFGEGYSVAKFIQPKAFRSEAGRKVDLS